MSRRGVLILELIARRLVALVVLVLVVSLGVFSLLDLSPGNAVDVLLGPRPRTPATVRALTDQYHLDKPFFEQYWIWLEHAARFDFGNSIQTSLPVSEEVRARLPTSLFLGTYAFVLIVVIGVGVGALAAMRRGGLVDRLVVGTSVVCLSTPSFVVGVLLLYVFAVRLNWFPAFGAGAGLSGRLVHLTLPALTLGAAGAAFVVKHARAAFLGVLDQDHVVFARARGLSGPRIFFAYLLRNAVIPIVTISGVMLSSLIVGAVLVEVTFSVQGIGQLLVQSANARDIPMLQCVSLLIAVVILVANLLADIAYLVVDPRVGIGRRG
jgi:peptide/nickel transport system permease protein